MALAAPIALASGAALLVELVDDWLLEQAARLRAKAAAHRNPIFILLLQKMTAVDITKKLRMSFTLLRIA